MRIASSPFADQALAYRLAGLPIVPCGRESGKQPLIKYRHLTEKLPPIDAVRRWAQRNPSANVGLATGPASGVTVVDVDEPKRTSDLLALCGDTPLIAETPSGGKHLYYRYAGEGCPVRFTEGADLRGRGGIIILPPSHNPKSGGQYRFIRGGIEDFSRLPYAKLGSLPLGRDSKTVVKFGHRTVQKGARADTLFKTALREARHCEKLDDLIDVLRTINDGYLPPLADAEVVKTAGSAWGIQERGDNLVGQEAGAIFTRADIEMFAGNGDALLLFAMVRTAFGWTQDEFPVAHEMRHSFGWGQDRFKSARDAVTSLELWKCTHEGGRGRGDASLFEWPPALLPETRI